MTNRSPQHERFYHLYNRGNNRQNIFFERENYLHFLRLVRQKLIANDVYVLAYCLMPNHYHLLVDVQAIALKSPMHALSVAYTKAINKRYGRVGSLFQGGYQSIAVTETAHLVHLTRYIHLNPVKANLVKTPAEWEFSSYPDYAGIRGGTLPQMGVIKEMVGGDRPYQHFLCDHHLLTTPALHHLLLDE